MKKIAILILFVSTVISLSAQTYRETRIFVPPIDGSGILDDMAFFYKCIIGEIDKQHRTIGRTRRTSDYVITGRLMPITEELAASLELPPGSENDEYILYLELFNNAIDEVIGMQYITYFYPDETAEESLSVIMYYLLSSVPDLVESTGSDDDDAWRNKWLYINLNFTWTPRVYIGEHQSVNIAGVGAEAMLTVHPLRFLGIKAGAKLSQDWVVVFPSGEESYLDMILEFPVAISFVARLQHNLMLEPYIGGSLNISMLGVTKPNQLSWMAGVQLSIKLGFGSITFDPRFSMDIGRSNIVMEEPAHQYWRYTVHLGVGYKVGFLNKKRK